MAKRINLSELAAMSVAEFETESAALVQASQEAKANGSPTIERRIRDFEVRYETASEDLLERLAAGLMRETADICEWLILLAARGARVAG